MSFDVYDVDLGKQLGSFRDEAAAMRRVRLLLEEFGPAYADDLEVGFDDGRPNLTGRELREQAVRQEDTAATPRADTSADVTVGIKP